MTASLLLDNVLAWSAQAAILVAVAAAAAPLLSEHPRGRLIFWQGILATMLALPLVEPWAQAVIFSNNGVSISLQPVLITGGSPATAQFIWHREYLLFIIAAGAVLRLIWIAAGFLRLRAHRLAAHTLADPPVPFEREHVRWYISDTISGPVTFGWMRPSIVLPSRVNALAADLREAIATHELVHVERADWLFVLGEEVIRAVLWFHPAVWFVLGRIQLSREQTVDREVIGLLENRERYLDALVAVAQHRFKSGFQSDVAPAPLFLKKRQLAVRVAAVLKEDFKETRMSKARLISSFTTVFSAALVAARIAVWLFPLQAPAQSIADPARYAGVDGAGIDLLDAGAPLMHRVALPRLSNVGGTLVVEASVNSRGEVADARVISGPDEHRKSALQSVLQWHYSTAAALPPTLQIRIKYSALTKPEVQVVGAPPPPPPPPSSVIKEIKFSGTTPEIERQVRDRIAVHEGDPATGEALAQILNHAREVDEHFNMGVSTNAAAGGPRESTIRLMLGMSAPRGVISGVPGGVPGGVAGGVQGVVIAGAAPAFPVSVDAQPPQRIRVGGNVQASNLVTKVTPAYPALAKQARVQGTVSYMATINRDGTIQNLELISGHPLLAEAATEAVKQWVYKPTLLNGNPVEVVTQIDVNFTLSQ
jgi:protein TonB